MRNNSVLKHPHKQQTKANWLPFAFKDRLTDSKSHFLIFQARAKMADGLVQMQEFGALATKLLSMFERQYTTLMKVRRPQQTVRVEHISVNAGAQAVIGNVNTGARGLGQNEGQPHATISPTAPVVGPGGSMLGENAPRDALPITGDAEGPLPNARWSSRQRRA